jgi:hypothetical protein
MHQPLEVLDAGAKRLREQPLPAGFADEVARRAAGLAVRTLSMLSRAAFAFVSASRYAPRAKSPTASSNSAPAAPNRSLASAAMAGTTA